MDILIYDIIQLSDAPEELKTPSLADVSTDTEFDITLDKTREIDCIGIGNTDATRVTINGENISLIDTGDYPESYANGLYDITFQTVGDLEISHNGSYIGRIGVGLKRCLGVSPSIQTGFWSTQNNRKTLSNQVVPGAGGVSGRKQGVKFTYKFTWDIFNDLQLAYPNQLSRNFPFFMAFSSKEEYFRNFDKDMLLGPAPISDMVLGDAPVTDMILGNASNFTEEGRFPWGKLYATWDGVEDFILQSSVNRFLYSKAATFMEAY
jgi:hypothetical protein